MITRINVYNYNVNFSARLHLNGPGCSELTKAEVKDLHQRARKINNKRVQDVYILAGMRNKMGEREMLAAIISNGEIFGHKSDTYSTHFYEEEHFVYNYIKKYLEHTKNIMG